MLDKTTLTTLKERVSKINEEQRALSEALKNLEKEKENLSALLGVYGEKSSDRKEYAGDEEDLFDVIAQNGGMTANGITRRSAVELMGEAEGISKYPNWKFQKMISTLLQTGRVQNIQEIKHKGAVYRCTEWKR